MVSVQESVTDYYWNHPNTKPFFHPKIRMGRKVKLLISWAEYQHWEHVLTETSPLEVFYRGCQIISDRSDRFIVLASDEKKFNEYLESEVMHLGQKTRQEMLEYDATGLHGEASQERALELLEAPRRWIEPKKKRSYVDTILEFEFQYSRQELDSLTEEQKIKLCQKEIEVRFDKTMTRHRRF